MRTMTGTTTDGKAMSRNVLWVGLILAASVAVACAGTAADADPTPVATFKITPASGPPRTPPPPIATSQPPVTATSSASELTVVGRDILFDKENLEAGAGTVVITFDNQDGGIPHNIHVFAGSDASGDSVGETPIENGPVKQELRLDLEPGEYFYVCDVHPTTMTGTLQVE